MIHVIARIDLAPGTRDAFLAEFRKIIPAVLAEQGCIEYGPAIDALTDIGAQHKAGADHVVVVEKWESVDMLKAHMVAPHMLEYRGKVKALVQGMQLSILSPAA